jgi:hypothetical protein
VRSERAPRSPISSGCGLLLLLHLLYNILRVIQHIAVRISCHLVVLLLGIFRRAPHHAATRVACVPFYIPGGALPPKRKKNYNTSSIREPSNSNSKVSFNVLKHFMTLKLKGVKFCPVFLIFPCSCTMQIALFCQNVNVCLPFRKL